MPDESVLTAPPTDPDVDRLAYDDQRNPVVRLLRQLGAASDLQLVGLLIFWLGLGLLFHILSGGLFFTPLNLAELGDQTATLAVASIGVSMVIIMGQFDLALGGAMALGGAVLGSSLISSSWPLALGLGLTLLVCLGLGALEGLVIVRISNLGFAVASFIVTLGASLAYPGLTLLILPETVAQFPSFISSIATSAIPAPEAYIVIALTCAGIWLSASPRGVLVWLLIILTGVGLGWMVSSQGLPTPVVIVIALVFLVEFAMQKTIFGRYLYAIGGNREAARLTGINVNAYIFVGFVVMGLFYALTGLLSVARLNSASPQVDQTFTLNAIAACAIGGVSLLGGRGRPGRALLGALILGTLVNGFNLMNLPSLWQQVASGPILIVAVWVDLVLRRRQQRRHKE
jgi:ABC-type xylose transport system permease subunit